MCTEGDIVSYVGPDAYASLSCGDFGTDAQCLIAIHCAVPILVLKHSWPPSRLSRGRRAERRGASAERRPVFIKTCPTAAVDTPLNQAQCRDSVTLVGDLRPEVLLGCLDYLSSAYVRRQYKVKVGAKSIGSVRSSGNPTCSMTRLAPRVYIYPATSSAKTRTIPSS